MQFLRNILLLLIILIESCFSTSLSLTENTASFWLTAELLSVEWRKGCLTTAGCAEPRFNLNEFNTINNETISTSWPVTSNIVQDSSRPFSTHWSHGSPEAIVISCEVIGTDPTYKFPRVCDSTDPFRIYRNNKTMNRNVHSFNQIENINQLGKMIIELKGKCYNATIAIERYDTRCPWCSDHESINIIEQYMEPEAGLDFLRSFNIRDHYFYALIFLSVFCAILSASFACLIIAFLFQKRKSKMLSSKQRLYHDQLHTVHPLRASSDREQSRCEIPWEHGLQYRPLPYYHHSSKNASGFPTIIDTTVTGPLFERNALQKSGTTRFSPNSSLGERQDDSGLESV